MESRLERIKNIVELIFKLASIAALLISGVWVWYNVNLTGERDDNIELSLSNEQVKLNDKSRLLVIHVHTINHGKIPVEIGGDKGGNFHITIKEIKEIKNGEWVNQENLPVFRDANILRHHKDGYVIEPNDIYDEVESIALLPGLYHIEADFDMGVDKDYFNTYSIVKVE
jgi:hypothetical protein